MCEIFAFNSKEKHQINDYLKIFYSHCNQHPHGWGFASNTDNKFKLVKEPVKASESKILKEMLEEDVIVKNALAHIRLATIGHMNVSNCHPFTMMDKNQRRWTIVHNGTIFDSKLLNQYLGIQKGQTDTERILLYIVNQINLIEEFNERKLSDEEMFKFIESLIFKLSYNNKLNILISNSEYLFAHKNFKNSLYFLNKGDYTLISTQALTNEKWKSIPINTLLAFKNGKIEYTGITHLNEYVININDVKFILNHVGIENLGEYTNNETLLNIINNFTSND